MKKVSIINNKNGKQFVGEFATQELADAWIAQERANQSWGKVSRWLPEDKLEGELIENALANELRGEAPVEGNPDLRKTWYQFPDEFTVTVTDITAEVATRNLVNYSAKAQSFGSLILADVFALNDAKALSSAQFDAVLADATLAKIERCLWQGSLVKAKELINTLDETFFSTAEKSAIVSKIDAFLTANGRM